MPTVPTDCKLFSVKLPVVPTELIVVTPEALSISNVELLDEVMLNTSMPDELTLEVAAANTAVSVSVPSPPAKTSPFDRLFDVEASNVSLPAPPVKEFRLVVSVQSFHR
jgi:hypothetical protein